MNGRQDFTFDRSHLLAGTLQNIPSGIVMAAGNYGDMATPLLLPSPSNVMRTNLSDLCRSSSAVGLTSAHQQYHGRCTSSFSWNTGIGHYCMASGLYSLFPLISGNDMTPSPCTASALSRNSFLHQSFHHSHSSKDLMLSSGIRLESMLPFAQQLSHLAPTFTTLSQDHNSPLAPYYTTSYENPSFQKRDTWSECHKTLSSDNNNNNNVCSKLSDLQQFGNQPNNQTGSVLNKVSETSRSKKSKTSKSVNKCESSPSSNMLYNKVELPYKKSSDKSQPRCQTSPNKKRKNAGDNFHNVQSEKICYLPNDNVALNLSRSAALVSPSARNEELQTNLQTNIRQQINVRSSERANSVFSHPVMSRPTESTFDTGVLNLTTVTTSAFTRTTNTTTTTTSVVTSCISSSRLTDRSFIQPLAVSVREKIPNAQAWKKTRKQDTDKLLRVPNKNVISLSPNEQSMLDQQIVQIQPSTCLSKRNRRGFVSDNAGFIATGKVRSSSTSILKMPKAVAYKLHVPTSKLQSLHTVEGMVESPTQISTEDDNNCELNQTHISGNLKCNTYSVESDSLITCATDESSPTMLSSPTPSLPCNSAFASSISPSYSTIAEDLWKASESINESQTELIESPSNSSKPNPNVDTDCDKKKNQKNNRKTTPVSLDTEEFTTGHAVTQSIHSALPKNGKSISLPCKSKEQRHLTRNDVSNTLSSTTEMRRLPLQSASKMHDKSAVLVQNNVQKVQPIPIPDRVLPLLNKQNMQMSRNASSFKNTNQIIYPAELTAPSPSLIFPANPSCSISAVSSGGIQPANTVAQQECITIPSLPKTISCTLSLNSVPLDAVAVPDQNYLTATKITPLENEPKTNLSVAQVLPVNMMATTTCEKPVLPVKTAETLSDNSIVLHNPTVSVNIPIGIAVARQRHEHTTTQTGIVASAGTWEENSRTALAPWITSSHSSTYWLPQNNYAATTAPFPLQFNSPDLTHLPFPPMGFQLVRDSITGHLLLIPTNIDLTDRTTIWPNYATATTQLQSAQPCQQVLIQQHVLQQDQPPAFDYRLPVSQPAQSFEPATKTQTTEIQTDDQGDLESSSLDDSENTFIEDLSQKHEKDKGAMECCSMDASISTQTETSASPSIAGSSNAYSIDDYGNADIVQLAQGVQTDSGKRSQGTSPIPQEEYTSSSVEQIAQTADDGDSYDENSRLDADFPSHKEELPQVADASNQTDTPFLSEVEDIGEESIASVPSSGAKCFNTCGTEMQVLSPAMAVDNEMMDNSCNTEEIDRHGLVLLSNSITEHEGTNPEKAIQETSCEETAIDEQLVIDKTSSAFIVDPLNSEGMSNFKFHDTSTPINITAESQTDSEVPENMQGLGGLGLLCALAEKCFVEVKSKDGHGNDEETPSADTSSSTQSCNFSCPLSEECVVDMSGKSDVVEMHDTGSKSIDNADNTSTKDDTVQRKSSFEKTNGLGLLAEFACCVAEETDKQTVSVCDCANNTNSAITAKQDGKVLSKGNEEISDSTGVKRKPGRPKKLYVKLTSINDYIPLKRMRIEIKPIPIPEEVRLKATPSPPNDLSPNLSPPKVSFLEDDAWHRRRSERIFLNDLNISPMDASKTALSPPHLKPMTEDVSLNKEKPNPAKNLTTRATDVVKAKKLMKVDIKATGFTKKLQQQKQSKLSDDIFDDLQENLADEDLDPHIMSKSDSENSDCSSQDNDSDSTEESERPFSVNEVHSWLIKSEELVDKLRVLTLKDGLFYAGHINAIRAPDVYGITYNGERGNRPHIYSREEILKIALLETKVDDVNELTEGMRICAYWSQQYRCLYPGTVKKCTSPDPEADENTVYVEFDDGDSGRIPVTDIRLLHHTFPIVSYDPNPLIYTGKRRYQVNSESNTNNRKCADVKETAKKNRKSTDNPDDVNLTQLPDADIQKTAINRSQHNLAADESRFIQAEPIANERTEKMPSLVISTKLTMENEMRKKIKKAKLELKRSKSLEKLQRKNETAATHDFLKAKKHKKHKDRDHSDEHHHRHHHRHHHHHHKRKHKHHDIYINCTDQSPSNESNNLRIVKTHDSHRNIDATTKKHQTFTAERNQTSELTVKIRTSSTELSQFDDSSSMDDTQNSSDDADESTEGNTCDEPGDPQISKVVMFEAKKSIISGKRKKRLSSVESKSKMAAFLPARQLWRWAGNSFKRPKAKGKARKTFYKAITRGKESIVVGDCAVFLSTGRPHLPYIGRIETMWESWGGNKIVRVKWFYHPEETKGGRRPTDLKGALYQSLHVDENDVQTISHKCEVLSWSEYKKQFSLDVLQSSKYGGIFDNNDIYYLAGTYDPTTGYVQMEPGICS